MTTVTPTTDTGLLPLLQKLAELAPDICLYEDRSYVQNEKLSLFTLGNGYTIRFIDDELTNFSNGKDMRWLDYAALQWAIQGAIAAKGWRIELVVGKQKQRCWCLVANPARKYDDGGCWGYSRERENPAIALLTAFISALEAAS